MESISAQGNFFTYTLFDPLRSKPSETALTSKPSKTLLVYFFCVVDNIPYQLMCYIYYTIVWWSVIPVLNDSESDIGMK